jgi:hypothetical protein
MLSKVIHKPSIGRYTKLDEPKARESLLTPSMRKSASKSSLRSTSESSPTASTSTTANAPSHPSLAVNIPTASQTKNLPNVPESGSLSAMPMLKVAQHAAMMERTPFAIDNAEDDEDEDSDDYGEFDNDDQVLDEVRKLCFLLLASSSPPCFQVDAFLEAHDSGLSEADKKLANGTPSF